MYKPEKKTSLEKSSTFAYWIKTKIVLIIAACMIGMSNAMYDEDKMINGNQIQTEQKDKK